MLNSGPFEEGSAQAKLFMKLNGAIDGQNSLLLLEVLPCLLPMVAFSDAVEQDRVVDSHEMLALIGGCIRMIEFGAMLSGYEPNSDSLKDSNFIRMQAVHKFLSAMAERLVEEDKLGETETSVH